MKKVINQLVVITICGIFIASCQSSADSPTDTPPAVTDGKSIESSEATSLKDALKAAKTGEYVAPTAEALHKAEALFLRTLKGEPSVDLQNAWQAQGFAMRALTHNGTDFTVVQEAEGKRTGRGFYAFRQKESLPIALQAPHSYKDLYTGKIASLLMEEGNYVVAGWNTVPRNDADMAHREDTIFQTLGRAFAYQYPTGTIVQLHGFAQGKRKTTAGKTADLIFSGTTRAPSQRVLDTGNCLKSKLIGFEVRIYPHEVSELGGTTNSNAKDLRERGFNRFFHVELSKPLREKLREDKQVRGQLSACLQ
ncbi:MAG: hypothetical protein DRR19_21675 [Candidatus Parabeggiatoa sp. nov. 1]|nr:MAG: hypothetical protein DRR19_21675 [Gammaproteobacteria bacterium]